MTLMLVFPLITNKSRNKYALEIYSTITVRGVPEDTNIANWYLPEGANNLVWGENMQTYFHETKCSKGKIVAT